MVFFDNKRIWQIVNLLLYKIWRFDLFVPFLFRVVNLQIWFHNCFPWKTLCINWVQLLYSYLMWWILHSSLHINFIWCNCIFCVFWVKFLNNIWEQFHYVMFYQDLDEFPSIFFWYHINWRKLYPISMVMNNRSHKSWKSFYFFLEHIKRWQKQMIFSLLYVTMEQEWSRYVST